LLGLLILGRGIFWMVGFLCDAVFYGVMVFGGFWFGWFLGLVSVPFSVLLDAVGCCFYIGALVGLAVWFLWRFLVFAEFFQFLPFHFCVFWAFFVAGLLFVLLALCCLFFIFRRLLDSFGFLSSVSLLFCQCFYDYFSIISYFGRLSNVYIFCHTFFDISLANA
jgi:hypothetical protein